LIAQQINLLFLSIENYYLLVCFLLEIVKLEDRPSLKGNNCLIWLYANRVD